MRVLNGAVGILVAAAGGWIALWAPPAFETLTGSTLPVPAAAEPAAMAVWSGVAFLRVVGAVLFGIGVVLWAASAPVVNPRRVQTALLISSAFAGLVTWAQQVAIWTNAVGWGLVGLFGVLA